MVAGHPGAGIAALVYGEIDRVFQAFREGDETDLPDALRRAHVVLRLRASPDLSEWPSHKPRDLAGMCAPLLMPEGFS